MARVTTKTGVANLTASLLKIDAVTSIDPPDTNSKFAKIANRWYEDSRREALAEHTWNCAETVVELAEDTTWTPIGRYGARYLLPADYIRIVWISDETAPEKDYKIKGQYIYINYSDSLPIGYIFDQEDITAWSPKFLQYMARVLAKNCAYDLTGNRTFAQEMEKMSADYLSSGATVDGQESPPTHKIRRSRWKAAKEGHALAGGDYMGRVVI